MSAVEKLSWWNTYKAQWLRVMMNELTRINSHLVWLRNACLAHGYARPGVRLFILRSAADGLRLLGMDSVMVGFGIRKWL